METEKYSIEHPKEWKFEDTSSEEITSGKLYNEGGQIEFWQETIKHYRFTKDQQEKQASSKETEVQIDGRTGKQVEYKYKAGGFFVVTRLPATEDKPHTTFWVAASSEIFKSSAVELIKTYKTLRPD